MNLFIDSNVVLDFLLERQPFFNDAKKFSRLEKLRIIICTFRRRLSLIFIILLIALYIITKM